MSILWENSFGVFLLVTLIVGGGAAWMAGRGIALTWRPTSQIALYMVLLAGFVRFLHFALYEGTLISLQFYLVDLAAMLIICFLGHRYTRTIQMTSQYHWLYEKTSPFSWREKSA